MMNQYDDIIEENDNSEKRMLNKTLFLTVLFVLVFVMTACGSDKVLNEDFLNHIEPEEVILYES